MESNHKKAILGMMRYETFQVQIAYLGYESFMLIALDFGKVWVWTAINHNLIQDIKNFTGHWFAITKDFTPKAHSKSYINTFPSVISMNNLSKILFIAFKLHKHRENKLLNMNRLQIENTFRFNTSSEPHIMGCEKTKRTKIKWHNWRHSTTE